MKKPVVVMSTLSTAANNTSSEIPNTRYGTTNGEKNSAEAADLPTNRLRRMANDARTPRTTAMRLDAVATITLRRSAPRSKGFERNRRYQSIVNPARGKDTSPALNEKIARIAIGR